MMRRAHAETVPTGLEKKKNKTKRIQLANAAGRKLTVILREYRPGDEDGMIACIRDEYGETYFKTDFYDPEYLRKEAAGGQYRFLVARTGAGEIAGMMLLKGAASEHGMCEIASQIFRKKYRGYGLAMPFFEYGMEILLAGGYCAACCLPVLFHHTTQRLLYRLGLRATGFILNCFDMERITHSYQNGRNIKHSMGIQIRAVNRRDAGTVYVPDKHRAFCGSIYESLGAACRMSEESGYGGEFPDPACSLSYTRNDMQSSLEIRVDRVGMDLQKRLEDLHQKYPLTGKETANLFLNINDRQAVWAYDMLKGMGYFFTGLNPLCGDKEYMVMHHAGEVRIWIEDYVLTEEFKRLAEYIKKFITTENKK